MTPRPPGRHEMPEVDAAGLAAARCAERLLDAARAAGSVRWEAYLAPLLDRLRDAPPAELRAAARRGRAAFGVKGSIADDLPWDEAMAFRDAIDLLLKALARREASST
jgi:hypothetical protein